MEEILNKLKRIELILESTSARIVKLEGASKFTGLSKSTIYKLTSSGEIPHYKKAKHLYFDKAELENWIKSNEGGGDDGL